MIVHNRNKSIIATSIFILIISIPFLLFGYALGYKSVMIFFIIFIPISIFLFENQKITLIKQLNEKLSGNRDSLLVIFDNGNYMDVIENFLIFDEEKIVLCNSYLNNKYLNKLFKKLPFLEVLEKKKVSGIGFKEKELKIIKEDGEVLTFYNINFSKKNFEFLQRIGYELF